MCQTNRPLRICDAADAGTVQAQSSRDQRRLFWTTSSHSLDPNAFKATKCNVEACGPGVSSVLRLVQFLREYLPLRLNDQDRTHEAESRQRKPHTGSLDYNMPFPSSSGFRSGSPEARPGFCSSSAAQDVQFECARACERPSHPGFSASRHAKTSSRRDQRPRTT